MDYLPTDPRYLFLHPIVESRVESLRPDWTHVPAATSAKALELKLRHLLRQEWDADAELTEAILGRVDAQADPEAKTEAFLHLVALYMVLGELRGARDARLPSEILP